MRCGFTYNNYNNLVTDASECALGMRADSRLRPLELHASKLLDMRTLEGARSQPARRVAGIHSVFVILVILFG